MQQQRSKEASLRMPAQLRNFTRADLLALSLALPATVLALRQHPLANVALTAQAIAGFRAIMLRTISDAYDAGCASERRKATVHHLKPHGMVKRSS